MAHRLLRIVPPEEAERLSTLSWDLIKRHHRDKILHVSDRRVGMRVGHALMLSKGGKRRELLQSLRT